MHEIISTAKLGGRPRAPHPTRALAPAVHPTREDDSAILQTVVYRGEPDVGARVLLGELQGVLDQLHHPRQLGGGPLQGGVQAGRQEGGGVDGERAQIGRAHV